MSLLINRKCSWEAKKKAYARDGIVQIDNFFDDTIANKIFDCLEKDVPWDLIYSKDTKGIVVPENELMQLSNDQTIQRTQSAFDFSTYDFQYVYHVYKIIDNYLSGRKPDLLLNRIVETMNQPPFLNFMRDLTGAGNIIKMDAMVAKYLAGHFLTQHDDGYDDEGREVTYILNFSKKWKPEWGGILNVTSNDRTEIVSSIVPKFNSLILFKPPLWHFVSQVASYAPCPRYTLTGWMMSK